MIKKRGNLKEIRAEELKLLGRGYIVFVEPYDDKKIYCLVAKKVWIWG